MKLFLIQQWANIVASAKALRYIWNKDVRGALAVAAAIFVVAFLLFSVAGCAVSPEYRPTLKLGMAVEGDTEVVGRNPVGRAGVVVPLYPFPKYMELEYLHLSSMPDFDDRETVDQYGITFNIPLGRVKQSASSNSTCTP